MSDLDDMIRAYESFDPSKPVWPYCRNATRTARRKAGTIYQGEEARELAFDLDLVGLIGSAEDGGLEG